MNEIGFTGTQDGMTEAQKKVVIETVSKITSITVHHGDCIGADSDFHDICLAMDKYIKIHPPINNGKRAFKDGHFTYPTKDYLPRNKDIVNESTMLIATPSGPEKLRSGTWSTVRYAKKQGKLVMVIYPDGHVEVFKAQRSLL
jgi:hypothetical protein